MLSSTQDVCYPNKKEVYSCQHNTIWLFRSQAIQRKAAALWLRPPKGLDEVENRASFPWLRSYSQGNLFTAIKGKLWKQLGRIPRIPWKNSIWLSNEYGYSPLSPLLLLFLSSYELNLITCQHRPLESYCSYRKQKLGPFYWRGYCQTLLVSCHTGYHGNSL